MKKEYDIEVAWRMFPLHPETPQEGQSLERLFNRSSAEIEMIVSNLQERARSLGLPFGENRTMTYNSRLAQELGLWAEDMGGGDKFHTAAFKAYFVDGQNLAKHDILLDIVERIGLDNAAATEVLQKRSYSDLVDRDWTEARDKRITAVPTFVMDRQTLVGAQPYHALKKLVQQAAGSSTEQESFAVLPAFRKK